MDASEHSIECMSSDESSNENESVVNSIEFQPCDESDSEGSNNKNDVSVKIKNVPLYKDPIDSESDSNSGASNSSSVSFHIENHARATIKPIRDPKYATKTIQEKITELNSRRNHFENKIAELNLPNLNAKQIDLQMKALLQNLEAIKFELSELRNICTKSTEQAKKRARFGFHVGEYLSDGITYFSHKKDICPNKEDYKMRKQQGEIFPMDDEMCPKRKWTHADKTIILEEVRAQVLAYLDGMPSSSSSSHAFIHTVSMKNLLAKVDANFSINWESIALKNKNGRHTAVACKAMWEQFLHPRLNTTEWTIEEDSRLERAAGKYKKQNWDAIAEEVGNRSAQQCFRRYKSHLEKKIGRGFTEDVDQAILQHVEAHKLTYGYVKWDRISQFFPHKARGEVLQHYKDKLDDDADRTPFTPQEDMQLLAAVHKHGVKIGKIPPSALPVGRCLTRLRERFKILNERSKRKPWTVADTQKLFAFIREHGTSNWTKCSNEIFDGVHTPNGCRGRYLLVQKHLKERPDASVENVPCRAIRSVRSIVTTDNYEQLASELRNNKNTNLRPKTKREEYKEERMLLKEQRRTAEQSKFIDRVNKIKKKLQDPTNTQRITIDEKMMGYNFFARGFKFYPSPIVEEMVVTDEFSSQI